MRGNGFQERWSVFRRVCLREHTHTRSHFLWRPNESLLVLLRLHVNAFSFGVSFRSLISEPSLTFAAGRQRNDVAFICFSFYLGFHAEDNKGVDPELSFPFIYFFACFVSVPNQMFHLPPHPVFNFLF